MSAGPEEIAGAVQRLAQGGVVAFPTETVYGLGADATRADAVAAVFALKSRPASNPLIVHVCDTAMARRVVAAWPPEAEQLARAFWPGPLTMVLPRSDLIPPIVTAGSPNVAVRCPDHPLTLALIDTAGFPLVGPSANQSGHVSPTTAEHVRSEFGDAVPVLDGGPCRAGIESTVVHLVGSPRVVRLGVISADELSRVLGRPVQAGDGGGGADSPGQLDRHYAPRARAVRFEPDRWPTVEGLLRRSARGVVISSTPRWPRQILMPTDHAGYAARLYAALREADDQGADLIAVELPDRSWSAIHDRIRRATDPS